MSIERTYYCDGPDCGDEHEGTPAHVRTASGPPYLPGAFIEVRERTDDGDETLHFCDWNCLLKYAAKQPIPEIIPIGGPPEDSVA